MKEALRQIDEEFERAGYVFQATVADVAIEHGLRGEDLKAYCRAVARMDGAGIKWTKLHEYILDRRRNNK